MEPAEGGEERAGRDHSAPWRSKGNLKWPGLPRGVKFEPSDEELMWHLIVEIGEGEAERHPFIGEFIATLDENEMLGFCFPHKLPGVKMDGSFSYFFNRSSSSKSNDNGSKRRRKIVNDELGSVRWHSVGRTKPVYVDGIHKGSKDILVLYMSMAEGKKPEKTNWVMHQYHVGVGEEGEGELSISKIFYQMKSSIRDKNAVHDLPIDTVEAESIGSEPCQVVCPDMQAAVNNAYPGCLRPHNNSTFSTEGPEEDILMDNHGPKDIQSSENTYCNMATKDHATNVKVEPFNHMQEIPCNAVLDNISPATIEITKLSESEIEEDDHVTLKERYNLMLSSMNYVLDGHYSLEYNQDSVRSIPEEERHAAPMGHLGTSIYALELASSTSVNTINSTEESIVGKVKNELQASDPQFLHEECHVRITPHVDARSTNPLTDAADCTVDHLSPSILDNASLKLVLSDKAHGKEGGVLSCQVSAPVVELPVISGESGHMNGKSQPESLSTSSFQIKSELLEENLVNNNFQATAACSSLTASCFSEKNVEEDQQNDKVLSGIPLEVKEELLEVSNMELIHEKNVEEHLSPLPDVDIQSSNSLVSSVSLSCLIRPKLESVERGSLGPCQDHSSILPDIDILRSSVKGECTNESITDFIDHISLRERIEMLAPMINPLNTVPPLHKCGSSKVDNAKTSRRSVKRKRKKTATNSVETALEEDAPGLLQVLLEKGITVEEIKLYGDAEDESALPICSSEDSFEELETIISKLFSEGPSIFKFPSIRQIKGSKALYCLACLISLIEQARYLRFRQSPVEWGWCRDLQSFIFVFDKHNRIVLERPEYGYATYFFDLVESLPINWQIKRLVTAMKLPCCSRTILLENKPLLVGEDLTEGEACVMEEFGWERNSGLGTMLNYSDRVVHDKKNERYSLEWRAKIGKLLMRGQDGGRTVLSKLPKKATKFIEEYRNPEVEFESY